MFFINEKQKNLKLSVLEIDTGREREREKDEVEPVGEAPPSRPSWRYRTLHIAPSLQYSSDRAVEWKHIRMT